MEEPDALLEMTEDALLELPNEFNQIQLRSSN